MPAKAPVDENVRFLYSCLIRSDYHYIDFHLVAADFAIKPAAARMRWSRLRKNIAVNSSFKNDPNLPFSQQKKRKLDGSGSGMASKKGKIGIKEECEDDEEVEIIGNEDMWGLKREAKFEGVEQHSGFGGFGMGIGGGFDESFAGAGLEAIPGRFGAGASIMRSDGDGDGDGFDIGRIDGPGNDLDHRTELHGCDDKGMTDVMDPMLFATSTSTGYSQRSSSFEPATQAEATSVSGRQTFSLPPLSSLPPSGASCIPVAITPSTPALARIASPIPASIIAETETKSNVDTTINSVSVTSEQDRPDTTRAIVFPAAVATAGAGAGSTTSDTTPTPTLPDKDHDCENEVQLKVNDIEQQDSHGDDIEHENVTCRIDKERAKPSPIIFIADAAAPAVYLRPVSEVSDPVMCPPSSGEGNRDQARSNPGKKKDNTETEDRAEEIPPSPANDHPSDVSMLPELPGRKGDGHNSSNGHDTIVVKPHYSVVAAVAAVPQAQSKPAPLSHAEIEATARNEKGYDRLAERFLRSRAAAGGKRMVEDSITVEDTDKHQVAEMEDENEDEDEEYYEDEDSDGEWVE